MSNYVLSFYVDLTTYQCPDFEQRMFSPSLYAPGRHHMNLYFHVRNYELNAGGLHNPIPNFTSSYGCIWRNTTIIKQIPCHQYLCIRSMSFNVSSMFRYNQAYIQE